jgi:SH3-like domain-containing protein
MISRSITTCRWLALRLAVLSLLLVPPFAHAQNSSLGSVTNFKIPRFVSLKSDRVNVRVGPSTQHKIKFAFVRRALPVEIIQEFDNWRRIRDFEGSDGWVHHSLLSGARTAIVAPWIVGQNFATHRDPGDDKPIYYMLEAGVLADVDECNGTWCRLSHDSFDGWIQQEHLWGVYAGERFE